jgi:hypothetical protein
MNIRVEIYVHRYTMSKQSGDTGTILWDPRNGAESRAERVAEVPGTGVPDLAYLSP